MCPSSLLPLCPLQAPAVFTGSDVRIRDPDQPALQFAVAFKGASWTDPDSIPLMVMQAGRSPRVFQRDVGGRRGGVGAVRGDAMGGVT